MFTKEKNFLTASKEGLSLSDAQAISNMCFQKALGIENQLKAYNNYSKTVDMSTVDKATSDQKLVKVKGVAVPGSGEVIALLKRKASYHALQAYLMEHINLKKEIIESLEADRDKGFEKPSMSELGLNLIDLEDLEGYEELEAFHSPTNAQRLITANNTLSKDEMLKYLMDESHASHVGQYIHKGGHLDFLRKELDKLPEFEIMEFPDGRNAVVLIDVINTAPDLEAVYLALADEHRSSERAVNAVKSKLKSASIDIENDISLKSQKYSNQRAVFTRRVSEANQLAITAYNEKVNELRTEHYVQRNAEIAEAARLRVVKHTMFDFIFEEFFKNKK